MAIALVVVVPSMSSCERAKQWSAAGKYVSEKNDKNYLELKADGTFFLQVRSRGRAGKYEIDGDQITLKTDMGSASRGKIDGNTMIDPDGDRWTKK